jgi:hypothetical protein
MKSLVLIVFAIYITNAHADSWMASKCSNADGSVKWESGEETDKIHLKYSNFVEGTLSLDISKVSIQFSKEILLRQKAFNTCQYKGLNRVFAGKVKIIGSEKYPDVLRSYFPENKVQTEVICSVMEAEPSGCTEN